MASPRQESTKNNRPSKEHLDHPTALGRRTAVYQKDSLLFGKQLIGSGDVVPCMAERSRERKTHSKRLGNTSNARDTDKEGKAESACCRGQRFTAGILISPQTDQLNTKEAATTQIWCDICHAGLLPWVCDVSRGKIRSARRGGTHTCWVWRRTAYQKITMEVCRVARGHGVKNTLGGTWLCLLSNLRRKNKKIKNVIMRAIFELTIQDMLNQKWYMAKKRVQRVQIAYKKGWQCF